MNFPVPVIFNMSQAICFVPAFWKDIKTYLTSYAYMQSIISKFLPQGGHKLIPNFVNLWKTTDHKPGNKLLPLASKQNKGDRDLKPELTEANNSSSIHFFLPKLSFTDILVECIACSKWV